MKINNLKFSATKSFGGSSEQMALIRKKVADAKANNDFEGHTITIKEPKNKSILLSLDTLIGESIDRFKVQWLVPKEYDLGGKSKSTVESHLIRDWIG